MICLAGTSCAAAGKPVMVQMRAPTTSPRANRSATLRKDSAMVVLLYLGKARLYLPAVPPKRVLSSALQGVFVLLPMRRRPTSDSGVREKIFLAGGAHSLPTRSSPVRQPAWADYTAKPCRRCRPRLSLLLGAAGVGAGLRRLLEWSGDHHDDDEPSVWRLPRCWGFAGVLAACGNRDRIASPIGPQSRHCGCLREQAHAAPVDQDRQRAVA